MNIIPRLVLWALIGLLLPLRIASAQDHQITPWWHNHAGAVSVSFDDGYSTQVTNAVPLLNARGLKGTFFLIPSDMQVTWDQWRQVAAQGHEIGSHTVTHPDLGLTSLSDSDLRYELSESQRVINQNIPSQSCISLAYPGNVSNSHVQAVTSEYYIAARGGWAWEEGGDLNFYEDVVPCPEAPDISFGSCKAVNFYNVAGDSGPYAVPISNLDAKLDTAIAYHAWYSTYFHTIPDETYYIDYLATFLDHIVARNLWMATFGEVAKYMRERKASTLSVLSSGASAIQLGLTNSLDGSIYNQPLTIRSKVPSTWLRVNTVQGGSCTIVDSANEGADKVVYFDAVPNHETIVLTQSQGSCPCSGDFNADRDVDGIDLAALLANPGLLDITTFAQNFGKNNCQ
jgi:peptidoglycan/xylan/chitin deacetylase (PgdA/CDA1 family)